MRFPFGTRGVRLVEPSPQVGQDGASLSWLVLDSMVEERVRVVDLLDLGQVMDCPCGRQYHIKPTFCNVHWSIIQKQARTPAAAGLRPALPAAAGPKPVARPTESPALTPMPEMCRKLAREAPVKPPLSPQAIPSPLPQQAQQASASKAPPRSRPRLGRMAKVQACAIHFMFVVFVFVVVCGFVVFVQFFMFLSLVCIFNVCFCFLFSL